MQDWGDLLIMANSQGGTRFTYGQLSESDSPQL